MQAEEFRSLLNEIYAEIIYIDFSLDGLYIGKTEEDLPVEDLHEKLAETLKVDTVTGIHIDDEEPTNVWVTYENTEDRTNFQMLKDVEALYPKEIGIISDAEIRFYNEALNVDKRDVSDLRNLRDSHVLFTENGQS